MWAEAIASYQTAIDVFTEVWNQHPENEAFLDAQVALRFEQADCYAGNRQWDAAIGTMQTVLDSVRQIAVRRALTAEEEQAQREGPAKIENWKKQ